jgi:hypothetical protein
MPNSPLFTYKDAVERATQFLGADSGGSAQRDARAAVQGAYRTFCDRREWSYYQARGRITTVAPQSSSSVTFDMTGGAYERVLTLAAGTWPTWAAFGDVLIGTVSYAVSERESNTELVLSTNANPGADVAAGTSYTIYRDSYPLPVDCRQIDRMLNFTDGSWLTYVPPRDWLERQLSVTTTGQPVAFTLMSDPNYVGVLAARFYPAPDQVYALDFVYRRRPRPIVTEEYSAGTASVTSGSPTLTGTGTTFSSRHAGCVVRLSSSTSTAPTGPEGENPATLERMVVEVTDSTTLVLDEAADQNLSGVKYVLSDPMDIEQGSMETAFCRWVERELAITRRMKERDLIIALANQELILASEADHRSTQPRSAGDGMGRMLQLRDTPLGDDLP